MRRGQALRDSTIGKTYMGRNFELRHRLCHSGHLALSKSLVATQSPSIRCVAMDLLLIDDERLIGTLKMTLSNAENFHHHNAQLTLQPFHAERPKLWLHQPRPSKTSSRTKATRDGTQDGSCDKGAKASLVQGLATPNSRAFYTDDHVPFPSPSAYQGWSRPCCLQLHSSLDLLHLCLCDVGVLESP